ncbi:peptidoglycan/LPS O-acetylase OafA/YrhL [Rhodanobacter sp. ANJX3]|uniref:acyltransferase family protein n=1 Tax=unclassified Rhodanobacter TaxID=2621553 RepID=UPI0015CEC970|nr:MULTISPECIES: acyltransferase [unclassified Rhodanobacter]MBB5360832.1 peptidoglycan/LPS O-acetylase OafA/YrhL [Rhodanobacter sp. ANJX3]NYE30215.1 peptidoglycan/LPS O-acetylase OafA/YrhL [Rhodanobacter sp. K2T2]
MHRENNFDAVRLLAAAVVIFGHAHPLTHTVDQGVLGNSVQALAVKIFFVISGYLICTSWSIDPNFFRYLRKRALRIFPGLIVLCLLTVFVVGPLMTVLPVSQYFSYLHTFGYFKNIVLRPVYDLPGLFAQNSYPIAVNGSLWSLPIEFAMYMVLPLLLVLGNALKTRSVLALVTLIFCAFSLKFTRIAQPSLHPVIYGSDLISALDVAPYFLIGAVVKALNIDALLNPTVALFFVFTVALVQPSSLIGSEAVLFILLPYCTLSLALSSQRLLSSAGRFGDFSYGLYLYGFLVQQVVNQLTQNGLSALQNALISLPIALLCAWFSWRFVEKPMLSFKPRPRLNDLKLSLKETNV